MIGSCRSVQLPSEELKEVGRMERMEAIKGTSAAAMPKVIVGIAPLVVVGIEVVSRQMVIVVVVVVVAVENLKG